MDGFAAWVDQAINNLRAGVTKGVVLPKPIVERLLPQLDAVGRLENPRETPFWQPLLNFPAAPSVAERRRLLDAYDRKLREASAACLPSPARLPRQGVPAGGAIERGLVGIAGRRFLVRLPGALLHGFHDDAARGPRTWHCRSRSPARRNRTLARRARFDGKHCRGRRCPAREPGIPAGVSPAVTGGLWPRAGSSCAALAGTLRSTR